MAGGDVALDRVFLEVRFPRRMAFIDHVGHLADGFEETFDEAEITPTEVRLTAEAGAELVLAPERIVVRHQRGDKEWAIAQLTAAIAQFGKIIGLETADYVGARQVFLHPVGGVSSATEIFRSLFFDYRQGPLTAFGQDPLEAQSWVAYRLSDGVCRVLATAISRQPDEGEQSGPIGGEPPGALLLDIDRTNDLGIDFWTAAEIAEGLLTDGYDRVVHFVSRLQDPSPSSR